MKASKTKKEKAASWSDVKPRLTHFDHDGLVGMVHDLYTTNKDNQVFLHTPVGHPEGLAELMVFYCERASGFSVEVGPQDEGFFIALVRIRAGV